MRFLQVLVLGLLLAPAAALASDPGQPLDCSDWVISEPGLGCSPCSDRRDRL